MCRCPQQGASPGVFVSLQTDTGTVSPGKRLPPIGYAAQLQLPEKLAHASLPLKAKSGWHTPGIIILTFDGDVPWRI